ncbi:MAG TPA: hypothetical protein V6D47_04325 [Oscillatoriaceae cyanobacterium]
MAWIDMSGNMTGWAWFYMVAFGVFWLALCVLILLAISRFPGRPRPPRNDRAHEEAQLELQGRDLGDDIDEETSEERLHDHAR